MNTSPAIVLSLALATAVAVAAPQTFDFKDPKGVNNAVFKLDAPLEAINGTANGISGMLTFDPDNAGSLTGKIVIDAASLHVPNPMMKEHLHGEQWVNSSKNKEIAFEAGSVKNVQKKGADVTADVSGKFTLNGVTQDLTVPVKLTYLKDKLGARTNGRAQGDLLVVRSQFTIKRSDFGINPGAPQDKVADEIELTLSLAGGAPRK